MSNGIYIHHLEIPSNLETPSMAKTALIIVDVQNDFLPGGALAVPYGDLVIPVLRDLAKDANLVVKSQDWHPENHCSFSAHPSFTDKSWPIHCVQGTHGAALNPAIDDIEAGLPGDDDPQPLIVRKGTDPEKEAYSAFDGTNLASVLNERGIGELWIGGLALDYCVRATALDAVKHGWVPGMNHHTRLYMNATKPVEWGNVSPAVLQKLAWKGVEIV